MNARPRCQGVGSRRCGRFLPRGIQKYCAKCREEAHRLLVQQQQERDATRAAEEKEATARAAAKAKLAESRKPRLSAYELAVHRAALLQSRGIQP